MLLFAPRQPNGGVGESRNAFAAPGEAELLAGCRLDRHAACRNASDLGNARAHGIAMRTDAGRLAHDRGIEMGDAPAARLHALDREREEAIGGGAAPLRITGREV